MKTDKELKKEQHGKLRALIQPLEDALENEPADVEETEEAEIWEQANDLYASLMDFFDKVPGAEQPQETSGDGKTAAELLEALSNGECKGIKGGMAYKIQQFAAERGFV